MGQKSLNQIIGKPETSRPPKNCQPLSCHFRVFRARDPNRRCGEVRSTLGHKLREVLRVIADVGGRIGPAIPARHTPDFPQVHLAEQF